LVGAFQRVRWHGEKGVGGMVAVGVGLVEVRKVNFTLEVFERNV